MVFQSYALYPHMTVRQNIGYGLKVRRTPKAEIAQRVDEVAELLGLDALLDRRPAQLSGGQRQRVAMGRAIVREPKAFLMDEPLSNLDAKLRVGMRASLAQLHARLGVTTVYVTHDQTEAMTLGQRVAVMRDGRILQVDAPQRLYDAPRESVRGRGFIGSPAMNLVEATLDGDGVACFGQLPRAARPARRPPAGADTGRARHPPRGVRGRGLRAPGDCRRSSATGRPCSRSSARTPTCSSASTPATGRDARDRSCSRTAAPLHGARGPAHGGPRRRRHAARGRPGALPFLRPGDGGSLIPASAPGARPRPVPPAAG